MGRTACTEPQCLYKGALYLYLWSWKGKAIPLLPLWAAWPLQSLSACKGWPLPLLLVMKEKSYTSTPPMGRTASTEPQCLYKGALYLYLWSWKSRAIPLLPLWAVRPVQSLSACTRVTFTFTFYLHFRTITITKNSDLAEYYAVSNWYREISKPLPVYLPPTSTLSTKRLQDTDTGIAQSVQRLATGMYRNRSPFGGRDFPYPSRPTLKPTMGTFFPEEKRSKSGLDHPPPSRALAFKACCSRAIFTFLANSSLIQFQDFMLIGIYKYFNIYWQYKHWSRCSNTALSVEVYSAHACVLE